MKNKNVFLSFVGINDQGKLASDKDGVILTALEKQSFDEIILLWNKGNRNEIDFLQITEYVKEQILIRKYSPIVKIKELVIKDVQDHNEIYPALKNYTDTLLKNEHIFYTASVSSGTPAMQVCWILLAESGDFSEVFQLKLVRIREPRYGNPIIVPITLDTSLPRIKKLNREVDELKKDLIPTILINISKGRILVDSMELDFSPIEYSYYRYFIERILEDKGAEKFSGISVSNNFIDKILSFHEQSYPDLENNRFDLIKIKKLGAGLSITTFRGNISKINKKIRDKLSKPSLINTFEIKITGRRGAKYYGIEVPKEKIFKEK